MYFIEFCTNYDAYRTKFDQSSNKHANVKTSIYYCYNYDKHPSGTVQFETKQYACETNVNYNNVTATVYEQKDLHLETCELQIFQTNFQ